MNHAPAMLARDDMAFLGGSERMPSFEAGRDPPRREIVATLRFAVGGGRTMLAYQHVPYPFHVTRPFYLDPQRQDLATLYLQSAAGGLYCGDRLRLAIDVAPGARAHVTTQASTIVHDTRGQPAAQHARVLVGRYAFAAVTPDPLVLFPGAAMASAVDVTLGSGACAILTDGFACHDPTGEGRRFARVALSTIVRDEHGCILLSDRGSVAGSAFLGPASPAGPFGAVGTVFALGRQAERLDPVSLEARLDDAGCLAGVTRTPHELGYAVRILAPDGGTLARGLNRAFTLAFEALLGVPPSRRRK
jgi:urease accessory protein